MYNASGAPVPYDYVNTYNGSLKPSTVQITGTGLNNYFTKYLLQEAISVFDWKLPKTWAENYFLYTLYCWGFLAVFETDKYGVITQGCGLRGYNVFYQPTHAVITNPLLNGIKEPQIGKQCTLIKLQPVYTGIMDIVDYYSNLMSLTAQAFAVNLVNSKLAYVFGAENKAQAESFKKMYDDIMGGNPAVFIDKKLFAEDGSNNPRWFTFSQNIKELYIGDELLTAFKKIKDMFLTDIGVPNANTDKRERLITDEVNANNIETYSKCELWLKTLKKDIEETNNMFGLDISVDWNKRLKEIIENGNSNYNRDV